jgi:hypothetical protein
VQVVAVNGLMLLGLQLTETPTALGVTISPPVPEPPLWIGSPVYVPVMVTEVEVDTEGEV